MKKVRQSIAALAALSVLAWGGVFLVSCSNDDSSGGSEPQNQENQGESGNGSESQNQENPGDDDNNSSESYDDSGLSEATLWVVGDSTVCDYGDYVKDPEAKITDTLYFYPRYGYGMQLYNYLSEKITVKNLALSGRSSKSFTTEANYNTLKSGIKTGDFLIIGFGHNDEKSDDADRFTDASKPTSDSTSFKYNLYEHYIKLAEDKGATPILCSPIVRLNEKNDYTGTSGHVTATGDYRTAVVELGEEKNVQVVDLTTITKNIYTTLTYNTAIYFHAMSKGKSDGEPELTSADKTHINIYGAKRVAYELAQALKTSECELSKYVNNAKAPTQANDLIKNPNYKWSDYAAVDWSTYKAETNYTTKTVGWYGTAFGDVGTKDPATDGDFYATETAAGVFKVGQTGAKNNGKVTNNADGFAFCFKQVPISDNFILTAKAKVLSVAATNQAGFGLMLRDDCYVPTYDVSILSNYVTASLNAQTTSASAANFSRQSGEFSRASSNIGGLYKVNETVTFTIERIGTVVTVTTVYNNQTYTKSYTDFDFVAKDGEYMYVGMFGTRGTTAEFTEVKYEKTGESQGA